MAALRAATMATTIQKTCPAGRPASLGGERSRGQRERQREDGVREADHPAVGARALERALMARSCATPSPRARGARRPTAGRLRDRCGAVAVAAKARAARRPGAIAPSSAKPERLGAAERRHAHDGARSELREPALQQDRVVEHVERRDAREAVAAERQRHPRLEERRDVGAFPLRGARCCVGRATKRTPRSRAASCRRRPPGRREPPRAARATRPGCRSSEPGSGRGALEAHVPEPSRGEETGPGSPAAAPGSVASSGDSARWMAAGPPRAAMRRIERVARRSAGREPRAVARDRGGAPIAARAASDSPHASVADALAGSQARSS